MNKTELAKAVELTIRDGADASGKTILDDFLEQNDLASGQDLQDLSDALRDLIPKWTKESAMHLKLARQIVRRTCLKSPILAEQLTRNLGQSPVNSNPELRLWISLILMDLGFPRT